MTSYLVFTLYGPLASWGEIAVGELRDTSSIPARSAIIGLIGAALGIRREDEQRLRTIRDGLGVGVAVVNQGMLLQDYHTALTPPSKYDGKWHTRCDAMRLDDLNTVLSWRSYRCEALYHVLLWNRSPSGSQLDDVRAALRSPVFTISLGRKSCVTSAPCVPVVVDATDLQNALAVYRRHPNVLKLTRRLTRVEHRPAENILLAADLDALLAHTSSVQHVNRRDASVNYHSDRWHYHDRVEVRTVVGET